MKNQEIEKYIQFLKEKHALDISVYDQSFLEKTIECRMISTGCETTGKYLLWLEQVPGESRSLLAQLSNSYSEFFRNQLTYAYLEQFVLPQLIEKKKTSKEKEIRIWSAACSSGQEAYSLAIICDELIGLPPADLSCRIFATDHSADELSIAQKGIYQPATVGKVTLKRIQTYFTKKGQTYTIAPFLRQYIDFSVFDLLSDQGSCPPSSIYGNFDLVLCCNLLFYYKPEYRHRILEKIGNSLAKGGYLITGESEKEIVRRNSYREVFMNSAIFQKR